MFVAKYQAEAFDCLSTQLLGLSVVTLRESQHTPGIERAQGSRVFGPHPPGQNLERPFNRVNGEFIQPGLVFRASQRSQKLRLHKRLIRELRVDGLLAWIEQIVLQCSHGKIGEVDANDCSLQFLTTIFWHRSKQRPTRARAHGHRIDLRHLHRLKVSDLLQLLGSQRFGGPRLLLLCRGQHGLARLAVRSLLLVQSPQHAPGRAAGAEQQHQCNQGCRKHQRSVAAHELAHPVCGAGRPRGHRLITEMILNVGSQCIGRLVAAGAILLQALHHDPVQIATQIDGEPASIDPPMHGNRGRFVTEGRDPRARFVRRLLTDQAHDLGQIGVR